MTEFYAETLYMKQGDQLPVAAGRLLDGAGNPVDISGGAQVRFKMRAVGSTGTPKVNAVAVIDDDGTEELRGLVHYDWLGTDTDTAGEFEAEFEVTSGGKVATFPNPGYQSIVITDDI